MLPFQLRKSSVQESRPVGKSNVANAAGRGFHLVAAVVDVGLGLPVVVGMLGVGVGEVEVERGRERHVKRGLDPAVQGLAGVHGFLGAVGVFEAEDVVTLGHVVGG